MATGGESWVEDIMNQITNVDSSAEIELWRKRSIYRVPDYIKDLNSKAYTPRMVSLGPYHHGEEQTKPMEGHKCRALLNFLRRCKKSLPEFVHAMMGKVQELQDSYDSLDDEKWRKDGGGAFVQLMIFDGVFMLEIMRTVAGKYKDYFFFDPIFGVNGMLYTVPSIKRDMLMIENQLPLLALQILAEVEGLDPHPNHQLHSSKDEPRPSWRVICDLMLEFFAPNVPPPSDWKVLGIHAMEVFRSSIVKPYGSSIRPFKETSTVTTIHSAMELSEAGIRFRNTNTSRVDDVSFSNGVLSLPVMVVNDVTEYMYLNLRAFERLHTLSNNEVTSYIFLMQNLIKSDKDVNLLCKKGIIHNALVSEEAVAKLFNNLAKGITLNQLNAVDDVHCRINNYSRRFWRRWRAHMVHTSSYFRSPLGLLSLAAAVFVVGLNTAQTVYTILSYYHH